MPNISQSSVRRNLFQQTLSRRPASTGPPNSTLAPGPGSGISIPPGAGQNNPTTNNSANTNGTNALLTRPAQHRLKPTSTSASAELSRPLKISENREIVVRDKNGGYKLDVPALPPALIGEDGEELGELDAEDGGESSMLDVELSGRDKESRYFQCLS
ncbi:hypothetical protein PoHVEF18_009837 [Penicillium ochrochloron]